MKMDEHGYCYLCDEDMPIKPFKEKGKLFAKCPQLHTLFLDPISGHPVDPLDDATVTCGNCDAVYETSSAMACCICSAPFI